MKKEKKQILKTRIESQKAEFLRRAKRNNLTALDKGMFADDEEVMTTLLQHGDYFRWASERLRNNRNFVKSAVKKNSHILAIVKDEFKKDKEIIEISLNFSYTNFKHVHTSLQCDKTYILEIIEKYPRIFQLLDSKLQNDKDIALKAISYEGKLLNFTYLEDDKIYSQKLTMDKNLCSCLRNDKELVMMAVSNDGMALEHASKQLKDDEEIVIKAIQNNGNALFYASERLKNDKKLALMAVSQNGHALSLISDYLQQDMEIVLIAMHNSIKDVPQDLNAFSMAYSFFSGLQDTVKNERVILEHFDKCFGSNNSYFQELLKSRNYSQAILNNISEKLNILENYREKDKINHIIQENQTKSTSRKLKF
jgi:hypothetical protein